METINLNLNTDLTNYWKEQAPEFMPQEINDTTKCGTLTLTELKFVKISELRIIETDNKECYNIVRSGDVNEDDVKGVIKSVNKYGYKYGAGTIVVEKVGNTYVVKDGHHRYEAFGRMGFIYVAVAVVKINIFANTFGIFNRLNEIEEIHKRGNVKEDNEAAVRNFINATNVDKNDFKSVLLSMKVLDIFNYTQAKMKKIVYVLEEEFGYQNSYKNLTKSQGLQLVSNFGNDFIYDVYTENNSEVEHEIVNSIINYGDNVLNYTTIEIDKAIKRYHEDGALTIIHFIFNSEHDVRVGESLEFDRKQKELIAELDSTFEARYSLCGDVKFPFLFGTFVNQDKELTESYQVINSTLSDRFIGFN